MPRPVDVEILSQSHTFVLDTFGQSGRRVVRIVFVVTHTPPRQPSGPFTVDIPVAEWTVEKTWAAMEDVASKVRSL
jgi:hypothetical protein